MHMHWSAQVSCLSLPTDPTNKVRLQGELPGCVDCGWFNRSPRGVVKRLSLKSIENKTEKENEPPYSSEKFRHTHP